MPSQPKFCPVCANPLGEREVDGCVRRACSSESCSYVWWDNPVPVVAAIVEHEGEIVLVRSVGWPEKMFGLVTGFLERGEAPDDGIRREIQEELGLETQATTLVGVYAFREQNQVIIAYHAVAEGNVVLGDELAGCKRIAPDRLRPWPFGTGHAVRDWLERRR